MKKIFTLALLAVAAFTAKAQNQLIEGDFNVGDRVTIDGKEWLVGKNLITNPSFDEDPTKNGGNIIGWTNGTYAQMTTSTFLWYPTGGHDGGAYIQSNKHTGAAGDGSVGQRWQLEPNSYYYFSFWLSNNSANNQYIPVISLTANESSSGGKNERTDVEDEGPASLNSGCLIGKNGETSAECLGYGNFIDENGDGYGEWAQTGMVFESEEYTYLQFNARWLKENKIQAAFDDFHLHKLYDPETTTAEQIAMIALSASIEDFNGYLESALYDYPVFQEEVNDWFMESGYGDYDESMPLEELQNAIKALEEKMVSIDVTISNIEAFKALLSEAEMLITKTEANPYPGIDAFMEMFDACNEYIDGGFMPEEGTAAEYLAKQTEALKQAIKEYKFSQEATPDNPADYTFLIQSPEFITADAEPTYDELGNATYPNVDSYTAGSAPADAVSAGWYTGEGGGDQRLNYVQGRVCWNAWRSGAVAPISISQDLEGLPNGVYSVSAYMITQAGYITDQHVFANGTIQSGNSPVLSKDTWNDDNTGDWDFLTTEKVIVSDGKLTIGALGNLSGEAAAGWFCVTHFVLNYYGKATEEDVVKLYNDRINDFTAYAEGMGFKADKKAFEEVVKANSGLTDYNEIQSALAVLNDAYATAQKSQSEYDGVLAGTYNDLKTNIAETYPEQTKLVAQKIVDIETQYLESDTASYVYSTLKTPILRYYRDNLLPVLQECEGRVYEDESAQKAMAETIQSIADALLAITDFPTTDELAVYVEKLNEALSACDAAERIHKNGINAGDDYTFAIAHPTVDDSNATGWTVTRTNGDANAKTGQEYDGGSGYYMDSWNPTAGLLLYTAQQTVTNIPNGTYEVKAMVRTSSDEGYYLFGNDGAEATPKFAHVTRESFNYTKYMDPLAVAEAGGDSIAFVTDQHGSIWEVAMDELMAATGINKPITLDDGTPYSIAEQISEKYAADVTEVPEELQQAFLVMSANGNLGRGWQYKTLQVDVTNHAITFGVTTDSTFTAGYKDLDGVDCAPFTGTWVSADNFTLTLLTPGDNTGWSPVYTEIEELKAVEERVQNGLFNLAGQRVGNDYKGIVITGGKKILKK